MSGYFIAFEGGEGGGKSLQSKLLAADLRAAGRAVTVTHEPGGTALGRTLRGLLLFQDEKDALVRKAETLLFAADRAQHVGAVVRPALDRGEVVITDRYIDSSLAYQGAGNKLSDEAELQPDMLRQLSLWAADGLMPDLTILMDIDYGIGMARAAVRAELDTMELRSQAFHARLRRRFLELAAAEPHRYLVLDASRGVDELAADIRAEVARRIGMPALAAAAI